jgi:hypothetical protein
VRIEISSLSSIEPPLGRYLSTDQSLTKGVFGPMSNKIEHLERTILELGAEVFRIKHRMDEVDRSHNTFLQVFVSLKKLLDEKGIISTEDFEDVVALDKILNSQNSNQNSDLISILNEDLKKVVN